MINVRTNFDTHKYKTPNVSHVDDYTFGIFHIHVDLIRVDMIAIHVEQFLTHSITPFLLFLFLLPPYLLIHSHGPSKSIIIHINVVIFIIHIVAHPFYCCARLGRFSSLISDSHTIQSAWLSFPVSSIQITFLMSSFSVLCVFFLPSQHFCRINS